MAQATFDSPFTLNPVQATGAVIRSTKVDHVARTVSVTFDLVRADGTVVEGRNVKLEGAAVQTWITNQESALLTRLLAKMGITGTIA